jgi:hypothetical protein
LAVLGYADRVGALLEELELLNRFPEVLDVLISWE